MNKPTIFAKRFLITGGAGHVGGTLARNLVKNRDNFVVIVDNLSTGSVKNLPSEEYTNWSFHQADVNDIKWCLEASKWPAFDFVFHYAAVVGVARTQDNPTSVMQDLEGIRNILDLSVMYKVDRVFFASSSEVYGEPVEMPQHEKTTPLNSRIPYAVVKNAGESYIQAYHQEYGLPFTILRLFNTYGPRQSHDFVITRFLKAALSNQTISIYGDGLQTRTYFHVDDHVASIERMIYRGFALNSVINVGNDVEITVLDLAKKVVELTGSKSKIVHKPALPAGDMKRRCPDISFLKTILDKETISLDQGLSMLIRSYKKEAATSNAGNVVSQGYLKQTKEVFLDQPQLSSVKKNGQLVKS